MALSPIPVMKKGFYEYYPDWVMKALEDQTGVALEKVPSDLRRELQKLIKWGSVEKALEPYQPPVAPVPRPPRPDLLPPEEAYPAIDWEQGRAVGSRSLGAAPPQYSPTTATLQSTGAITKGPAVPITAWSDPGPCPEGCSPYEWTLFGKCYPDYILRARPARRHHPRNTAGDNGLHSTGNRYTESVKQHPA